MKKNTEFEVIPSGAWEISSGGRVEYYKVGDWSMELTSHDLDQEVYEAKRSIKSHKAWYRWLKKQRRNKIKNLKKSQKAWYRWTKNQYKKKK